MEWAKQGRSFFILAGKKPLKKFYVYLLECADGSLYCGWTDDLNKRVAAHKTGRGAKYTRAKPPVQLAYFEEFDGKSAALKREFEIKQMTRQEKERLVQSRNA
ncbi:MAG: GIY-YIG nuclease family protein [Candidatus Diapherotrites archaeon]